MFGENGRRLFVAKTAILNEIGHTVGTAQHRFFETVIVVRLWTGSGDVFVSLVEVHFDPTIGTKSGS